MPLPTSCRYCGSSDLTPIRCATGPHHAKLTCDGCGRCVAFLPRPRGATSAEGFRRAAEAAPARLPDLLGTPRQVAFARTVRAEMLRGLQEALSPDAYRAMRGIADASWWIANKGRKAEDLRWPADWFVPDASACGEAP